WHLKDIFLLYLPFRIANLPRVNSLWAMIFNVFRAVRKSYRCQQTDGPRPDRFDKDNCLKNPLHFRQRTADVFSMMKTAKGKPDCVIPEGHQWQSIKIGDHP